MKIVDVDGIVLQDTNYSESSKILNVLTKEYGLIDAVITDRSEVSKEEM